MFISLNFYPYVLQIMYYVFNLSSTHASQKELIPSIADIRKHNIIEITSMCYDDNTTHLDYEAIRHHLRFRYLAEDIQRIQGGSNIGFSSYDICKDPKKLSAVLTEIYLGKQYRISSDNCEKSDLSNTNVLSVCSFMPPYLTKLAVDVLSSISFKTPYFASNDYFASITIPSFFIDNKNILTIDDLLDIDLDVTLNIVRANRLKHILLVYSDNDVQSLTSIHREKIWKELMKIPDICIDMIDLTNSSNKNISSLMEYIKKKEQIKLIIIWPNISTSHQFIEQTNAIRGRLWMWYPKENDQHNKSFDPRLLYIGYIDICLKEIPDEIYTRYIKRSNIIDHIFINHPLYILSKKYAKYKDIKRSFPKMFTNILNDTWIKRFNSESRINLSTTNVFAHFDEDKGIIGEHIEALMAPFWQKLRLISRAQFHDFSFSLTRFMIMGLRGEICRYNSNFQPIYPFDVNISNYRGKGLRCKPIKCPPGKEPFKTTFTKTGYVRNFGWTCKKCPSDKVKLNYSTDHCISCPGRTIPDKDIINCFDPYIDEFLAFTDYKSMIILSILLPFLTYNVVLIFIFSFRRKTPIIVASGSTSNLFQLSAHLFISIELLVLFFGKLNATKCTLQVVTTGLLYTLILSLLFTKTQKTLFVFKAKTQITRNDVILTKAVEIFVSAILIAVQILISVISYFHLTPTVITTIDTKNYKRKVTCDNMLFFRAQFVYILILAILCSIQALRARNLPKYFTATAEIGYSMYITVVVILVRFPILSSEKVDDKNFANVLFIIVLNIIPMVIRYTNTFYTLLFRPERNTKEYVRNVIMRNIRQKTEEDIAERNRQNASQSSDENRRSKEK